MSNEKEKWCCDGQGSAVPVAQSREKKYEEEEKERW